MKKHSARIVTVIACICFAAAAASLLAGMIRYRAWGGAPALAAAILIVAGLVLRGTLLLSAGALIRAVIALYTLLEDHGIYISLTANAVLLLRAITSFAASALLLALALSKRRSVLLGWLSGGFVLLSTLLYYYGWTAPAAQRSSVQATGAVSILLNLAAILAPILAGYARRELPAFRESWKSLFRP